MRIILFIFASQVDLSVQAATNEPLLLPDAKIIQLKQKHLEKKTQKFVYGEFSYDGEIWLRKKNDEIQFVVWSGTLLIHPRDNSEIEVLPGMQTWIGPLTRENFNLGGVLEPTDSVSWIGEAVRSKVIKMKQAKDYLKISGDNKLTVTRSIASSFQNSADLIFSIRQQQEAEARQRSRQAEEKHKALKLWYWQTVFDR